MAAHPTQDTERIVNVYEAKTQLSRLLTQVESGDEVVIARSGQPVARLVKWVDSAPRVPGAWKGRVRLADDFDSFTAQDEYDWFGDAGSAGRIGSSHAQFPSSSEAVGDSQPATGREEQ